MFRIKFKGDLQENSPASESGSLDKFLNLAMGRLLSN